MATLLADEIIQDALANLPDWSGGRERLSRTAELSEEQDGEVRRRLTVITDALNHHADIERSGQQNRFTVSTHSEGGVTNLDIVLASQIDSIMRQVTGQAPPPRRVADDAPAAGLAVAGDPAAEDVKGPLVVPPSPGLIMLYRTTGWRLEPEHHSWVLRDVRSAGYPRQRLKDGLVGFAAAVVLAVILQVALIGRLNLIGFLPIGAIGVVVLVRRLIPDWTRDRALRHQGLALDGTPSPPAWYERTRSRRVLRTAALPVVLILSVIVLVKL